MILKITILLLNYILFRIVGLAPTTMILEIIVLLLNYILNVYPGKGSNLQPLTYQVSALPIELPVIYWTRRDSNA